MVIENGSLMVIKNVSVAMSLAWPMYQRPLPSTMTHNPRIIGAKQEEWHRESGKRADQKNPKNGHPPPSAMFKNPRINNGLESQLYSSSRCKILENSLRSTEKQ